MSVGGFGAERQAQARRGPMGPPGADGKGFLAFNRNPLVDEGSIGDFYVNYLTLQIWGPKVEGGWGDPRPLGGPQGEKGDQGDQGEQGIQGEQGDQGEQGLQGVPGEKGDQGDQGLKGDKGDTGDQGLKGDTGDQGEKGDQGDEGPQGEQGLPGLGSGDVVGPASSVDNQLAVFSGITGKLLKAVTATASLFGLGNVDNTHDADKPVSTLQAASIALRQLLSEKNQPNGYAGLDGSGILPASVLPPIAVTDVFVVASQAAMLALTAEKGDVAIRSDLNKSYILATNSPGTLADWKELLTPTDVVLAVAGLTGTITASALKSAIAIALADVTDMSANARTFNAAANYAAMRTALGVAIGTDVQAYDADLAAIAALATNSYGRALLTAASASDIKPLETIMVALSDESTAITTGTAKVTMRMPYAFTLLSGAAGVRASLSTASSSGIPTVDINEGGVSILSTKLTIDASEKTSTTAAVPAVISDTSLADDAEITFDIDVAGTGAKGLKAVLIGYRT